MLSQEILIINYFELKNKTDEGVVGALFLYGTWIENAPEYGIWEKFTQIW